MLLVHAKPFNQTNDHPKASDQNKKIMQTQLNWTFYTHTSNWILDTPQQGQRARDLSVVSEYNTAFCFASLPALRLKIFGNIVYGVTCDSSQLL